MKSFDPHQTPLPQLVSVLQGSICPRPIAFAATVSAGGAVNLSPFSFFNLMGTQPPVVVFAPNRRGRDGSAKHTFLNVQAVPEVSISLVSYEMVQQVSLASCEFPEGVNEFIKAGFTEEKSVLIRPPRVQQAPVQLECRVLDIKSYGYTNLVICGVLLVHVQENLLDERGFLRQEATDWVARMGGDAYTRARAGLFEVPKPNREVGMGFDRLPPEVRNSPVLTGNDLGLLANETALPSAAAVAAAPFLPDLPARHRHAQGLLAEGRVAEAWAVLLRA